MIHAQKRFWHIYVQDAQGNVFFFHEKDNASTYEHPMDKVFRGYYKKIKKEEVDMRLWYLWHFLVNK
jgi:hypothetical protein